MRATIPGISSFDCMPSRTRVLFRLLKLHFERLRKLGDSGEMKISIDHKKFPLVHCAIDE